MPVDLWSGSDYSKTINYYRENDNWFACVGGLGRLESVQGHSSNGERSIKCNFIDAMDYCEYHICDFDETKSYTASFDVYCGTGVVLQFLAICQEDRSLDVAKGISCPAGSLSKVSVTLTQDELYSYHSEIKIRCLSTTAAATCYVDNWSVMIR